MNKEDLDIYDKLLLIQTKLKAPKSQYNSYGNFYYRSCEDILEALKPLLKSYDLVLTLNDELVNIGERYYVKASAILTDGVNTIVNSSYAREEETKKGMDGSQITGSASSYARKIALNGLCLIDDVRDSDTEDKEEKLKMIVKLGELIEKKGADREKILEYYKVNSDSEMTINQLDEAIKSLEKRK